MTKEKLIQKIEKEQPEFAQSVQGRSVEELEKLLVLITKEKEKVTDELKENPKIKEVSELKKEMEGPFKDTIKALKLRTTYLINAIAEKGGAV